MFGFEYNIELSDKIADALKYKWSQWDIVLILGSTSVFKTNLHSNTTFKNSHYRISTKIVHNQRHW